MPLFLQNSKHKSITSNSIAQTSYIQAKCPMPKNLFNITGYIGPGQAAGVKSSCIPDPTLALINQIKYMRHIVFLPLPFLFLFIFHVSYVCHISI